MPDAMFDPADSDECRRLGQDIGELFLASVKQIKRQEYRELLERYDADPAFRHAFLGMMDAMGAVVIDHDERLGLVIGARSADSAILERIERGVPPDDRRMMAVALTTILALYYTEDVEADPTAVPRPLSVEDVYKALSEIISTMRQAAEPFGSREEIQMWEKVAERMSTERTNVGRYVASTMPGIIEKMFRQLERRDFVQEIRTSDGGSAYQANLRLTVMVRERLNHSLFIEIRQALASRNKE